MYRDELDVLSELRRRRLLGGLAIAGIFLAGFVLNGFRVTPVWTLFENDEGTFAAGDPYAEWVYAVCNGEEQQVTVLRDGRLEGVSALDSLRSMRFPNWCDGLPTVDNPELAEWQAELARLEALTASSDSAAPILEAAEAMPVSVLYLRPISEWIRDEGHALSFLDTVAARPMRLDHPDSAIARARRGNFAELVGRALDAARNAAIDPARLERWLASAQIAGSGPALERLARLDGLSEDAKVAVLERLDAVSREQRSEIYFAVAPGLAQAGQHAPLLVDGLRELPRQDRLAAARQLLAQPDVTAELPLALLSSLGRGFEGNAQLELFMAIADALGDEADAPQRLAARLRDIGDRERRLAANHLLGLDGPGETAFALAVLGSFADLHPMSRPKLMHTLIQSAQFNDPTVQQMSLLAIQLQVRGPDKQELLTAMLRHPALDGSLSARISAELGGARPRDRNGV